MADESVEWQPAIIRRPTEHPVNNGTYRATVNPEGRRILIRPTKRKTERYTGCTSERWFAIHPDDCGRFELPTHIEIIVCEHCILTD